MPWPSGKRKCTARVALGSALGPKHQETNSKGPRASGQAGRHGRSVANPKFRLRPSVLRMASPGHPAARGCERPTSGSWAGRQRGAASMRVKMGPACRWLGRSSRPRNSGRPIAYRRPSHRILPLSPLGSNSQLWSEWAVDGGLLAGSLEGLEPATLGTKREVSGGMDKGSKITNSCCGLLFTRSGAHPNNR